MSLTRIFITGSWRLHLPNIYSVPSSQCLAQQNHQKIDSIQRNFKCVRPQKCHSFAQQWLHYPYMTKAIIILSTMPMKCRQTSNRPFGINVRFTFGRNEICLQFFLVHKSSITSFSYPIELSEEKQMGTRNFFLCKLYFFLLQIFELSVWPDELNSWCLSFRTFVCPYNLQLE